MTFKQRLASRSLRIAASASRRGRDLVTRQDGQGMVEYALILVLVSVVVILVLTTMGGTIRNVFSNVTAVLGGGS